MELPKERKSFAVLRFQVLSYQLVSAEILDHLVVNLENSLRQSEHLSSSDF